MKWKRFRFILILSIPYIFCTQPPSLEIASSSTYRDILLNENGSLSMKGSGDVNVCIQGNRYSGSADIIIRTDRSFTIDAYSPFGATILSIYCNDGVGEALFRDTSFEFNSNHYMSVLPFSWGRSLTYEMFLKLLASRFSVFSELLSTQPELVVTRKSGTVLWSNDTSSLIVDIIRSNGLIKKIDYVFDKKSIEFSNFEENMARRIKFFENDNNYFIINYEKITTNL